MATALVRFLCWRSYFFMEIPSKMRKDQERLNAEELQRLHSGEYFECFESFPRERISRLIDLIQFAPTDIVVDYGCGIGLLLDAIHGKVASYTGVDFSEDSIRRASERQAAKDMEHASFVRSSIEAFCAQNPARFDKAFALDFSEHVYDDQWLGILRAIRDSMRPGGLFYMHTPDGDYVVEILKRKGILRQFPEHIAVRGTEENIALLEKAGFTHIEVHHLAHYERRQAWLHRFRFLPVIGSYLSARLFFECRV